MSRNSPLLVNPELKGCDYVKAHAAEAKQWFGDLFSDAVGDSEGLCLVAMGGLGRGELWPQSDIDLILLHDGKRSGIGELAEKIWYPAWDRGLKLGHGVFTIEEAIELAGHELDQATSLLYTSLLGGDHSLMDRLDERVQGLWQDHSEDLLGQLADRVVQRHLRIGDVAFKIEPELKEGRGGLRDLHSLSWAEAAAPGFAADLVEDLTLQHEMLVSARVELHRTTGRAGDTLTLDDQDDVALAMGEPNAKELMLRIALAGRRIAWHSDEAWSRWERSRSRRRRQRVRPQLSEEVELVDELIELRADVEPDALTILRLAEQAARTETTIGRETLLRLQASTERLNGPWSREARKLFANLLLAGHPAIRVIEDLDQFDLMVRILPEWAAVRCHPQRNVMHTFTVDRHLCEAAANAAELAEDVDRPDLLVVGALLHDIGKGYPGDHTEVGMMVIETITTRMGYRALDAAVLVDLCRHHLLLPDVATRRDISDPGTVRAIAAAVDSVEFLYLLAALTQADSMATGPAAWGSWKARMIQDLVERTALLLEGRLSEESVSDFPPPEIKERMEEGDRWIRGRRTTLTVIAPDQPGMFGRLAGVLAMTGLGVVDASAYSDGKGMSANQFSVLESTVGRIDWERVVELAESALDGRLALSARVAQKAAVYNRHRRRLSAEPAQRLVNVDNSISDIATVVDVHAPDTVGLLFRVAQAIEELDLDIRSAKVQTLGPEAVDSFYLTHRNGDKLHDPELLSELEFAIREIMGDSES